MKKIMSCVYKPATKPSAARLTVPTLALALGLICTHSLHAAYITEYFNGYGTSTQNLSAVASGGGTGWAADWSQPGDGTAANYTDYVAGGVVNPTVTG